MADEILVRFWDAADENFSLAPHDGERLIARSTDMALLPYARYEVFDTQEDVPGGVEDPAYRRRVLTAGLAFKPHPNVILKAEREERRNDAHTEVSQWNVGLGYLF